jgi:hypothetical protein
MLSAAKHLAARYNDPFFIRRQTLRFAQGDSRSYNIEYRDRTVSMSEAARQAIEKLAGAGK